ncbi:MAG TPA: hypothetical protein VMQ17_08995 [Candidatus Sulfotelmatobacter sp.]|nr:hypothetical protein [Candidatus Sulfotelmatobacter sp.]
MVGKAMLTSSPKERKPPKVLDHLRVYPQQGEGEGHLIEHHFTHYEHQPERHVFASEDGAAALAHIAQHAGINTEKLDLEHESEPEHGAEAVAPKK